MPLTIKTNHAWRDFKYRNEVPAKVLRSEFDWTNEEDHHDGFIHYRGWWYHISQFEHIPAPNHPFVGWDGFHSDSFFSGIVINLSKDSEQYQIGTYFS